MDSSQLGVFPDHPASKSIPLEKYSCAVSHEESRSHRWVHDVRKDLLTVTFKPVEIPIDNGSIETHLIMTVTAGRETLQHLDIHKLVRWSQEHNDRVCRGLISTVVESPVQVIVRFPCIAMRFPGAPSMVQRFQLKFRNDKQYFEAFNILRRAGLPLKESTAEPKKDAPSQGHSVTHNQNLPSNSTHPLSTGHLNNHRKTQFAVPSLESSQRFTSMDSSSMPPRSDTSSSLSMRPSSIFSTDLGGPRSSSSLGTSYKDDITSNDFCFQPPPPRPFSSTSVTRSSPLTFASQIETQQRATSISVPWTETTSDIVEPQREQAYMTAPILALSSKDIPRRERDALEKSPQLPDIRQLPLDSTVSQTQRSPHDSRMKRSATATQSTSNLNRDHNNEHLQLGRQSSLSFSTTRPMSAPTVGGDLHLSQWIPPKRELPFPKRKEPKKALEIAEKPKKDFKNGPVLPSESTGASEKLANAMALPDKHGEQKGKRATVQRKRTPPTSKLPTVLEVPDSDEARPTNAPRNSTLWQEELSPLASKSASIVRPSTAPGLKSKAMNPRKRPNEEAPKWELAKRVKMVDSSTQTQTLSGRDHTSALSRVPTITAEPVLPASATAPAPDSAPVPAPAPVAPPTEVVSRAKGPTEGFLDELECFIPKHGGKLRPAELWEVSPWDKATGGERDAMAESWICEQIEDPAFLEWCKHVDHVWKQIGFKT
ncbi:hypothetical protein V492_02075 [Pseudogymnoascus sp. VKM F-4246]|nr:hypothetical protein V492_02075 [Pseudogymnoascus sp. VKM F-4246]